jgi:hypothetical protein
MSLQRILVPVSSGEHIRHSLHRIGTVVNDLRADLTLIRILDPFREGGPKPAIQEWKGIKPEQFGVDRFHCHVDIHPDPVSGLAHYADENKMDVIMMPPRPVGLGWLFPPAPTFSKRLLAASPCPVWSLDGEGRPGNMSQRVQRVLCAVSGNDLNVLKFAATLCAKLNARLFLLHVVPEINEGLLAYGLDDSVALTIEKGMELLADMQGRVGVSAQPIVEMGNTTAGIRRAAKTLNVDLVITGRGHYQAKKHNRLLTWFFTPPLLRSMPCQVLAV